MASSDYKQILLEIGFARSDKNEVGAKRSSKTHRRRSHQLNSDLRWLRDSCRASSGG